MGRKAIINPVMALTAECPDHQGPTCPICQGKGWNYLFNCTDGTVREGRDRWERKPPRAEVVAARDDLTPPAHVVEVLEDPTGTYAAIVEVRDRPTPTAPGAEAKAGTT